jgi:hypothetical protein
VVLVDYLEHALPSFTFISSADRDRLRWASDPACFSAGCFVPCQPTAGLPWRWPYSASFMLVPAAWDRGAPGQRISQTFWETYLIPGGLAQLGAGLMTDVAFPSRKVLVHDTRGRHDGTVQMAFADPRARLPLLFADGAARVKHTSAANPGWQPNQPASPNPTLMDVTNQITQCTPGGAPAQFVTRQVTGVYRWTRGGLAGRDFAGPEINTGQRGDADDAATPMSTPAELLVP